MTEEQARRVNVFFYGLFMNERVLQEKGINPVNRRLASVDNFSLVIGTRATLVPDEAGRVYGLLYSLTHSEVDALYTEPSVSAYRPEAVLAELGDGEIAAALCFNLPVPPPPEERNPQYAAKLKELAARIGLPQDYVSRIQ
jgi:hypothetical protein